MDVTKRDIYGWTRADIAGEGERLFASGAVTGTLRKGNIIGGAIKIGAARFVVRLTLRENLPPEVDCRCAASHRKRVCAHAVAVALDYLKRKQPQAEETPVFSAEHAPTRLQIQKWADGDVLRRAEQLLKSGDVSRVQFSYPEGRALVLSQRAQLAVSFKMLPNGLATGTCACSQSRDYGRLCEHIVAAMLAVMHSYGSEERRALYAAERRRMEQLSTAQGLICRAQTGIPAMIRVFLPPPDVLRPAFYQDQVKVAIRIFVEEKPYKPQELISGKCYAFSEADETLLGIFEDIAGGAFADTLCLSAADTLSLLRCAGRSWVGFASPRQRLNVETRVVQTPILITPSVAEDALNVAIAIPEASALFVRGAQGFLMHGAVLYPVKGTLPLPYQSLYAAPVKIPREAFAAFFQRELPQMQATVPLHPESASFDLFTTTPGEPRFCLKLEGSLVSVAARLEAFYGASCVTVGSPEEVSLPDPDDFYHCYVRNREAESAALERTTQMGFLGRDGKKLGVVNGNRAILNLLGEHIPAAKRAGWRVELSGAIQTCFEQAEMIVPVVTVTASEGGRAFEVQTSYDAPEGKIVVTPQDIERALAHRNAYIEKNGALAFLDIGAIQTLRDTLASCRARAGSLPGSSKIDAVHAPFIDAALAPLEGLCFEAGTQWRKRVAQQNRTLALEPVDLGRLETTLRPYQKEGVYWLRFLETCGFCGILADEMGLGKTLQTLTWLQLTRVRSGAQHLPSLIVCPTSLVENWRREALKFVPWLRCLVLSGGDRARLFARVPEHDLVITSYALIRRDGAFHSRCKYGAVVLDEAQAIKNQRTQNAQAVKALQADTRLVLSGTPIENGVADLWSIMDFLMPEYLGKYEAFKVRYEDAVAQGGRLAEAAQEQLRRKLHPFLLRRVKKDVAPDLPDKIRSTMYCELTSSQRKVYDKIREHVRSRMRHLVKEKGFERSRFEVLADLMRLRQICCDLRILAETPPEAAEEPSAKLEALMELLSEARSGGHRVLVFSQFTSMLKRIAERLEKEGFRFCYLDGSTKQRVEACIQFNQNPTITVFLISLKAGGTGLNLTGADTVVHFDPWWNPAVEEQATDRAHRIGQKKTVQVIKMIAQDTIEEKVLELQQKKRTLIEATVNASDDAIVSSLTMAEIETLLD